MYTLAIGGTAVAVTNATQDQAQELFSSEEFRDDIASLESNGAPIWDGSAAMEIRASTQDEREAFEEAMADDDDDLDEDGDEEAGIDVLFLVPIDEADGPAA